jgi:ribosomal protein S18 acetylase RimI-like enzyme
LRLPHASGLAQRAYPQAEGGDKRLFFVADGCGYARQLLQHLIAELETRDVMTMWLEVRASNHPAIALYEQLDFHQVIVRPNYYPTANGREDAIIMALTL